MQKCAAAIFLPLLLAASVPTFAAGDAERGRTVAEACIACHGPDGSSPSPTFPILGGQHQAYLVQAMLAYKSGTRSESIMGAAVRVLDAQQIEDVAAYFATRARGLIAAGSPAGAAAEGSTSAATRGAGTPPAPASAGAAAGSAAIPPSAPAQPAKGGGATARASTATQAATLANVFAPDPAEGAPAELSGCPEGGSATRDRDGDGLADVYDAAPRDRNEFVVDADGNGWFGICSIEQLQAIQTLGTATGSRTGLAPEVRNERRYEIVRDLDASTIDNWLPIGNCGPENNCMIARDAFGFAGAVDGKGHTIRGLRISRPQTGGVGLFGTLARTGVVRNIVLDDARVTGLHGTGALVGSNFGLVTDCRASVDVTGQFATAGLIGGHAGLVNNCHVTGKVDAAQAVGGLVGDTNGVMRNSSAGVDVTAKKGAGGLVGLATAAQVINSRSTGSVTTGDNAGGLIGVSTDALVESSYSTASVNSTGTNAGGLVGFNSLSLIRSSFATGDVKGATAVGALVGRNNGTVSNAYATGHVSLADGSKPPSAALVGDNTGGTID